jgi:hypothetical protein
MVVVLAITCFFLAFAAASYLVIDITSEMVAEHRALRTAGPTAAEELAARRAHEEAQRALAEAIETAKRASDRLLPLARRRASRAQRAELQTMVSA